MTNTLIKLTIIATIVANISACGGSANPSNTSATANNTSINDNNSTTTTRPIYQGYWQSDDTSQIIAIDSDDHQNQSKQYQLNPLGCMLIEQFENSLIPHKFGQLSLSTDQQQLNWQAPHSIEKRSFSRINELPASCQTAQLTQANDNAELNFNWLWHAIDQHYAGFEARNLDWRLVKQDIDAQIATNPEQNWMLMGQAIDYLADPHALLISSEHGVKHSQHLTALHQRIANTNNSTANSQLTETLLQQHLEQAGQIIVANYLQNPQMLVSEQVIYGELHTTTAYLNLRSMNLNGDDNLSNLNAANQITSQLNDLLTNKSQLVIDLRFNLGGNVLAAKTIADYLCEQSSLAYNMSFKQSNGYSTPIEYHSENQNNGFTGDIKILTSPLTGSAAEAFIYYLQAGHNHIELIGENTRGAQSGPITHQLPNGWQVLIPARKITDSQGNYFENSGIPANINIESFSQNDINNQQDAILDYLLQ